MRWVVISEPAGQDMYDMLDLRDFEIVEAESEWEIYNNAYHTLPGSHINCYQVKDNTPLGYINYADLHLWEIER